MTTQPETEEVVKERNEISIYEFLKQTPEQQLDAWYDWFCKESSLTNKTKNLVSKLKQLILSPKININNQYVFFKNNCPINGNLYDDFRICDMKTGDVVYTITPSLGYRDCEGKSSVWGKENNFNSPLVEGMWKDVLIFFKILK